MQIKTTTTLDISPENEALLPIVAMGIGYSEWVTEAINDERQTAIEVWSAIKIEEARLAALAVWEALPNPKDEFAFDPTTVDLSTGFTFDESIVDTSIEAFIKYFLAKNSSTNLKSIIAPTVITYFGGVMKTTSEIVNQQLETAVNSTVEIIKD